MSGMRMRAGSDTKCSLAGHLFVPDDASPASGVEVFRGYGMSATA
jgi:hypothetical protein